jgi:hypothetical protein
VKTFIEGVRPVELQGTLWLLGKRRINDVMDAFLAQYSLKVDKMPCVHLDTEVEVTEVGATVMAVVAVAVSTAVAVAVVVAEAKEEELVPEPDLPNVLFRPRLPSLTTNRRTHTYSTGIRRRCCARCGRCWRPL